MVDDHSYLSQEKFEALKRELEELKTTRRRAVAERLEFARSMGDLSENAEYHAAREEQADIENRISQIDNLLKTSSIIAQSKSSRIEIGSSVRVKKNGWAEEIKLTIVGSEEADPRQGKISYQSPLGENLLGKNKGDAVTINTPQGEVEYLVTAIDD